MFTVAVLLASLSSAPSPPLGKSPADWQIAGPTSASVVLFVHRTSGEFAIGFETAPGDALYDRPRQLLGASKGADLYDLITVDAFPTVVVPSGADGGGGGGLTCRCVGTFQGPNCPRCTHFECNDLVYCGGTTCNTTEAQCGWWP